MLVTYFAHKYAERMAKQIDSIPSGSMEALVLYPWPGNIRELQNFIERAVIVTGGDVLRLPALPSIAVMSNEPVTLEEAERDHILNALRESCPPPAARSVDRHNRGRWRHRGNSRNAVLL